MGGVYYAYQDQNKPIVELEDIDGKVTSFNRKFNELEFVLNLKKRGGAPTKNGKIFTTFIDIRPNKKRSWSAHKIDPTFSSFPDLVSDKNLPFVIQKFVDPRMVIDSTKPLSPLFMFVHIRWEADRIIFSGRTFSTSVLLKLLPALGKDNRMHFQIRTMKGPYYKEIWFANKDDEEYLNEQVNHILIDEDANTMFGLEILQKRAGT